MGTIEDAKINEALRRYYGARDGADAAALNQLILSVLPVIRGVLRYRLDNRDGVEDLCVDASLNVYRGIQHSRASGKHIEDCIGYAKKVSYHVFSDHIKRKNPWWYLKLRVLYLIDGKKKITIFAQWKISDTDEMLGGLRVWLGRPFKATRTYFIFVEDRSAFSKQLPSDANLPLTMERLFRLLDTPLEVDKLVTHLAELGHIRSLEETSLDDVQDEKSQGGRQLYSAANVELQTLDEIFGEEVGKELWKEILCLPMYQRTALLMGMEAAEMNWFRWTFSEIAEALAISHEQFFRIWSGLPLKDEQIAEHLGIEGTEGTSKAQKVTNLRRFARDRLRRRMATWK